jgi:protein disulfide-isomerase A4
VNYLEIRTDPNWVPPPTEVIELTGKNFKSFLVKKPLALALFYAEYCQHCVKLKPEYINAAETLKPYGVPLVQIEGTKYKEVADEFKVKAWPTLLIFRQGRAFEYKGGREAKDIIATMKEQLQSPTTECKTVKELENRYDRYIPTIVGAFTGPKSPFYEEFFAVANYLRGEPMRFIHTFDKDVRKSLGYEEAVIVKKARVFSSDYELMDAVLPDPTKSGDEIAEFIRANYRPLVGQRNKNNQALVYSKRPLVVVYYDANFSHEFEKNSQRIRNKVVEVAKDFPEINFAVSNEDDYADELEAVKLGDSGVDVNVVWYDRLKYRMDPVEDFDGSDLRAFVHQATNNKLKPVWKSQPIPKRQEGPVFMAVADNFEEGVFRQPKDIVFYIFAPWCGHCKEFDKTFRKLAKKLSSDTMLFAKMDGTLNDIPPGFEVKGYPTVFFVSAKKKHEILLYEGDRSYAHVKNFILDQSTKKEDKPKDEL